MKNRLIMPLLIPVGALVTIFLVIFAGSHVLLAVKEAFGHDAGPYYATGLAIVGGAAILLICTVIAVGPRLPAQQVYALAGLPVAAVLGVGLYIAVKPQEKAEDHGGAAAVVTSITQIATDNRFSVTAATAPANTEVTLTLENRGVALHNWAVQGVKDASGKDIKTELLAAGKSETIKFTIATPGTYTFVCDVHPSEMTGKLTIVEAAAGAATAGGAAAPAGGAAAPAGGGNQIVATDNKFDKATLTVKANEEASVTLVNRGSAIHDFSVQGVKDKSGKDIKTQLLTAGKSETVTFVIERPGTYDYVCSVHPTEMRGKLTVQ